jgi:hypothetical protein
MPGRARLHTKGETDVQLALTRLTIPKRAICTLNASNPHGIQERSTIMQRVGVWALGLGLFITVGLLTMKHGYTEAKDQEPTCTLKTLQGRYLFGGIATLLPPAVPEQSLLAVAGYHIFNGDGTGIDIVTGSINGVSMLNNNKFDIKYTVNPDCSGTYTVLADGVSFGLFIAPDGEELIVIGTEPGFVLVQGPNRRVSDK